MSLIIEPIGVDFFIDSSTMTEEDTKEISNYIQKRKAEILKEEAKKNNFVKSKQLKSKVNKVVN